MTRDQALQAARNCLIRGAYLTPKAAQEVTVRPVRRWPIFGRVVAWRSNRIQLAGTFLWVVIDDVTGNCAVEKSSRRRPSGG
jgi:hypothetical protein